MSISSVTSNPFLNALSTQSAPAPQSASSSSSAQSSHSETGEITQNGQDVRNDGDSDDRRAAASTPTSSAQTPAVINTSGQVTGQHINIKV